MAPANEGAGDMARKIHETKRCQGYAWLSGLDLLTAFFAFWFGAAFDDLRPVPVRIRPRKR